MNCQGSNDDCFNAEMNPALKREIKLARREEVPDALIKRVIQYARQGFKDMEFDTYNIDWDSEAYLTVSGQNSNNTVRVTDAFLHAVEEDKDWTLIRRLDHKPAKTVKARELWGKIGYAAWASADPGVQFHTTINDWHTCPAGGEIRASNPCSEYMFIDDTACNLASLNLLQFRDEMTKRIDIDAYEHAVRLWTVVLEISVLMAQFPSREIAQLSYDYRTLGLGYANVGGLLMSSGVAYDSAAGRAIAGALSAIMTGVAYATSAEMAKERGPFARFMENREADAAGHPQSSPRRARRACRLRKTGHGADAAGSRRLPRQGADRRRRTRLGDRAHSGRALWLSQRAGHRRRADRHHRPRHGLRHHRHRARFRAGEIQEAGRRRLSEDRQPRRAGSASRARLSRERDRRDGGLCGRPRDALQRAGDQHRIAARQGLSRTRSWLSSRSRSRAPST